MRRAMFAVGWAGLCVGSSLGQDWLDDFNDGSVDDGSPVTWVASPAFNSEFEVVDGDLLISIVPGGGAISSPRVDSYFASGASVRARMYAINTPGRYTVAFADQPTGIKGYVASFSTCDGGRIELFRGDRPGIIVYLGGGPVPYPSSPEDEFLVQLDVFDGVVSARVWRPGEPFPEPQVIAADVTYSDGVPSIAIQDFGDPGGDGCSGPGVRDDTMTIVRFAQASSTPLTHSGAGDTNADGVTDAEDFFAYLDLFASGDPTADLTGEGVIDGDDFFEYLDRFALDT